MPEDKRLTPLLTVTRPAGGDAESCRGQLSAMAVDADSYSPDQTSTRTWWLTNIDVSLRTEFSGPLGSTCRAAACRVRFLTNYFASVYVTAKLDLALSLRRPAFGPRPLQSRTATTEYPSYGRVFIGSKCRRRDSNLCCVRESNCKSPRVCRQIFSSI